MGYYLMTPGKNVNPTFERIECKLAKTGVLDRVSLSRNETRVCFEFQRGFKRQVPGRTLYVADFDTKGRKIINAKPFANEDGKPISRMVSGGIMLSHDYSLLRGVKQAFDEFVTEIPEGLIEFPSTQCMIVKR